MKVINLIKTVIILLSFLFFFSTKLVIAQTNWKDMLDYYKSNKAEADLMLLEDLKYSPSEINFFFYHSNNLQCPKIKLIVNIIVGNLYFQFNEPQKALIYYNQLIENLTSTDIKSKRLHIIALINKSKIVFNLNDSISSINLLNAAIERCESNHFTDLEAKANYYLAFFLSKKEPNKAKEIINKSIEYYTKKEMYFELTESKLLKSSLFLALNQKDLAKKELDSILRFQNISQILKTKTYIQYGNYYTSINQDSSAIYYYTESMSLSEKINNFKNANIAGNALFILYKKNKQFKEAFETQRKIKEFKDTLTKVSSFDKLFLAKNQNQFLTKENTVSDLQIKEIKNKLKIQEHKNYRQMLYVVFLFFIILLIIIVYFYILTRNFNQKLVKNNEELTLSNESLVMSQTILEQQSKNKDRFFSIIAHDLRSPFNSVLGLSEYLSESMNELGKSEIIRFNEMIYTSSKSLYNLLENLLDWSKTQIGKLKHTPNFTDLFEVVESELEVLRIIAKNKEISIISNIPKESFAYFDKEMISTVIRNITNNAIKFTPKGGMIELNCKISNSMMSISIKDNGIGIAEENLNQLFDAENYFTTYGTEGEKGTGLGLAICKEFIILNKGSVSVKSTENIGTEFIIKIPTTKEEAEL